MSRTLCIFKPDLAANRHNAGQALMRLLAIDLVPSGLLLMDITIAQAMRLYAVHEGQPYYRRNIEFMTSGPCVVMVLDGEHAVERLREIVGSTDPKKAQPGTLRAMFGTELPRNAVHASASDKEAADEIRIFFNEEK